MINETLQKYVGKETMDEFQSADRVFERNFENEKQMDLV